MTASISAAALPNQIEQLLTERQQHTDAIGKIDKTLASVMAALGTTSKLPKMGAAPAAPAMKKAAGAKNKKGRSKFAVSATDLILAFLKPKPATTKEITQHVLAEGRSTSSVSNALSVMTKAKKIKRTPLGKGEAGSTYELV